MKRAPTDRCGRRPLTAAEPHRCGINGLQILHPLGVGPHGGDDDTVTKSQAEQRNLSLLATHPTGGLQDHSAKPDRRRGAQPGLDRRLHVPVQVPKEFLGQILPGRPLPSRGPPSSPLSCRRCIGVCHSSSEPRLVPSRASRSTDLLPRWLSDDECCSARIDGGGAVADRRLRTLTAPPGLGAAGGVRATPAFVGHRPLALVPETN